MELYDPKDTQMTALVAQMWARINDTPDMEKMFAHPHTLATFFKAFEPPCVLLFDHDDEGITAATWFEPVFDGAFVSYWVRSDRRKSKVVLESYVRAVYAGLKIFRVLIGLTKQEELLDEHVKFGYTVLCQIPRIFGGKPAWLVQIDEERFLKKWAKVLKKNQEWVQQVEELT